MTRAVFLAAVSWIGLATPVLAQHAGHGAPSPTQAPAPATGDRSCPPEHAAMGHCTPKAAVPVRPPAPTPAPARNPHAGHDMSASPSAAPAVTRPTAPSVTVDTSCPPEHAAMGHCTPKSPAEAETPPGVVVTPPPTSSPQAAPADPACPPEHAAMGHCTPAAPALAGDPHAGHGNAASPGQPAATADPTCPPEHAAMGHCTPKAGAAGAAPPVAPPPRAAFSGPEHAADTVWDPQLMARKRENQLIAEHGGYTGYMVLFDRLEYRALDGRDGYAWDAEGWYGGDYNRLWIKTEGEGEFGEAVESAEVQALYSRAINPWFNLQAGVRYDIRPKPDRAHLVLGAQGLAPYWFEVDAAAFLSDEGDLTARFEAEYDQRITNRLILQPRVEFDLAAQDVPELGIGAGLSTIEAGLRLRYEIKREFAPYVGVQYERRVGDTADFARAADEDVGGWSFLVGLRSWF